MLWWLSCIIRVLKSFISQNLVTSVLCSSRSTLIPKLGHTQSCRVTAKFKRPSLLLVEADLYILLIQRNKKLGLQSSYPSSIFKTAAGEKKNNLLLKILLLGCHRALLRIAAASVQCTFVYRQYERLKASRVLQGS